MNSVPHRADGEGDTTAERPGRIAALVRFATRRPWLVVAAGLLLGLLAATFAVSHFSMTSDTDKLISGNEPWRQRQATFARVFQPEGDQIVAVIDGATPELAEQAADALDAALVARPDLFHDVIRPDSGDFFRRNGLLYESLADVRSQLAQLETAQPFLGPLASDPSLRGLAGALSTALAGVGAGDAKLAQIDAPIRAIAGSLDAQRAGRPAFFSWRTLISGKPDPSALRHLVLASPNLDYAKLQPGASASAFIRQSAARLRLDPAHGVRVRLTGAAPLQDEEFGTLADRAALIGALAVAAIVVMLWFAVRSPRLIAAILITMFTGLVTAAAAGLAIFHRFNLISVAFIPLFVGLGIDFGIQMSVRFRTEQATGESVDAALVAAGAGMGRSLTLAATAIALGFLAFAPTAYVGLSQLGVIAGIGMFVALLLNLSLLPALVRLFDPPPPPPGGQTETALLARLDSVILGHRRTVIGTALVAAVASAALLPLLHFDFNALHLKNQHSESVRTLFDLMRDPDQSPNTLELIEPNLAAADAMAARLSRLSSVEGVRTLDSFVPDNQPPKLAAIAEAANLLDLTLDPVITADPPSDGDTVAALRKTAADLRAAATGRDAADDDARRLAGDFDWLAQAPPAARAQAQTTLMPGLQTVLAQTRDALGAQPVTIASLPDYLRRDWLAADGRARVSIVPKGDSNNNRILEHFIRQVRDVAPDVTGAPVDTQKSGEVISGAFMEAGLLSFVAIMLLLFVVLRRPRDVAITLAPIVLTGLLTLGSCVVIGQPLNFANIIALPLLFGIGVAFHIYFVMAWRDGGAHLLQSSLSHAIFFSALATATGFGSLWASSHPGTASMGELLMISLVWTLVSALLFQPALMGPPPEAA